MRKLVMTAARNGYFFVLDRVTGEHLLTSQLRIGHQLGGGDRRQRASTAQPRKGRLDRRRARIALRRRHDQLGAAGVQSAHRPLLRRGEQRATRSSISPIPTRAARWGSAGTRRIRVGSGGSFLTALDYRTGKARVALQVRRGHGRRWRRPHDRRPAGLRRRRRRQHRRARRGHRQRRSGTRSIGDVTNPPQTYLVDGRQYLLVAAGNRLFAFVKY